MRHSVITWMFEMGSDPASIQGIVGHSNLTTTLNVYTHSRMSGKRRATEKLSEFLSDNAACSLCGSLSRSFRKLKKIRKRPETVGISGTGDGNRTHTSFRKPDFESGNSAKPRNMR